MKKADVELLKAEAYDNGYKDGYADAELCAAQQMRERALKAICRLCKKEEACQHKCIYVQRVNRFIDYDY